MTKKKEKVQEKTQEIKFIELDLSECLTIGREKKPTKEELEKIETKTLSLDNSELFKLMQLTEEKSKEKENKEEGEATNQKEDVKEIAITTEELEKTTPKEDKKETKIKDNNKNKFIGQVQERIKKQEQEYKKNADINFPYKASKVVTNAELKLYHFMLNNLCKIDDIAILPKVRLGDLIQLDTKVTDDKSYYWKVACKHVDFVICRKDTLKVICVVELDDYTHETEEARKKDMFIMQALKTAGIDTVRIKTKIDLISKADLEFIDEYINKEFAPNCPRCGLPMIPRKCMRGPNTGHRFYACANNITCRYTINIDK